MLAAVQDHRPAQAQALAERLLKSNPQDLNARHALALIAKQRGELPLALQRYNALLTEFPQAEFTSVLLHNRGNIRILLESPAAAMQDYQAALALNPDFADCWNSLGNAQRQLGEYARARECYQRAQAINPNNPEALSNIGSIFQHEGQADAAIRCYRQSLAINPRQEVALYNMGNLLAETGNEQAGKLSLEQALLIKPDYPEALSALLRMKQGECDWQGLDTIGERLRALVAAGRGDTVFPFAFVSLPSSRAEHLACAQQWMAAQYTRLATPYPRRQPQAKPRIRLGYVSADLHEHATAFLMAEVFERHDRQRFEVIAYSAGPDDHSPIRQRLQQAIEHFVDVRELTLAQLAQRIHDDGVDILVDLKGYTRDTRTGVLAWHPAPVQVSYLGYPGSMGAHADYIIGDPVVSPVEHASDYSEALALMPWSYQCNDRQRPLPEPPSRAELGLPEEAVVLCCFNNSYKLTRHYFQIWCAVLHRHPQSVLWLLQSKPAVADNLRREAAALGIDSSRLHFAPVVPLTQHLARMRQADIFLDTEFYSAHTTASDALWTGVPVVTRLGAAFPARVAASLLRAVGLDELIAVDDSGYQTLIERLISDTSYRRSLHQHLENTRLSAPLFDSARFTRHLELLYQAMWQRCLAGLPPAGIGVSTS